MTLAYAWHNLHLFFSFTAFGKCPMPSYLTSEQGVGTTAALPPFLFPCSGVLSCIGRFEGLPRFGVVLAGTLVFIRDSARIVVNSTVSFLTS